MELKQFGIDVVIIEPGAIKTEWNRIARENLVKASGNSVYRNLVGKHVTMLERGDKIGSEPVVIARVIAKAINSKKPRTRYPAGGGAKLVLFARRILSDRTFDRLMLNVMK
jgi:NAD(P)-dependent dehydrogenase (short-subunit alcohol dehydrogenase family)